jgi:phenylpropionate dioxygenase-like ring-hydroxylating dioxygenase large terminal subunit
MEQALQVEILKGLLQQLDAGKNIDAGVQYRMSTTSYVCPDIAAREWDAFFQHHPQLIGLSGDLPHPGSFLTLNDFEVPLLATRDKDRRFRVFLNACRHRAARVASEERGRKTVFTCPFHQWGYGNNGELISVPDNDHFGAIDKSCHGLVELPAVERDGLLWVHPQVGADLDVDELLGETLANEIPGHDLSNLVYAGGTTIDRKLNWKLANDTFGETYHFGKLHRNTLGQIFLGNNLHFEEFGRHHRFVTANRRIYDIRDLPESEWVLKRATFVMYYLFPNVQLINNEHSTTLVRVYPDRNNPGRSVTRVSFYYTPEAVEMTGAQETLSTDEVYNPNARESTAPNLAASLEVFSSTIEQEDYVMGEMQQEAAQSGRLKEVMFGRNEPALHHFHNSYREALNLPPLEAIPQT